MKDNAHSLIKFVHQKQCVTHFLQALGPIATYRSDTKYNNCISVLAKWNPSSEKWTDIIQIITYLTLELKLSLGSPDSKYGVFPSLNCPFIWPILYFLSFSFKALQCHYLHCYTIIYYLHSKQSHKCEKPLLSALSFSQMAAATKGKKLGYHTRELESLLFLSLPSLVLPQRKISNGYFKAPATLWSSIDRRTREIRYNQDCFPGKVIEKRHCARAPLWVEWGNCLQLFPLSLVSGSLWWLCVWGLLLRYKLQSLNLEFFLRT